MDLDIIISGIIIRNIGLINYFNDDMLYSISDENENLGSTLIGINLINDYCNIIDLNTSSDKIRNEYPKLDSTLNQVLMEENINL